MGTLDQVAGQIIKEQELVIGPLAWLEAQKVIGVRVISASEHTVTLEGPDPKIVIDQLVNQYERLFGRASHEVCREAAADSLRGLSLTEIPSSLR